MKNIQHLTVVFICAVFCGHLFAGVPPPPPPALPPDTSKFVPHFVHPGAIYTQEDIDLAKKRAAAGQQPWKDAYDALMREADDALKIKPDASQKFNLPWRYVDPKGNLAAGRQIRLQSRAAYTLALAALLTDDADKSKSYATHAAALLKAWTGCSNIGTPVGDEAQPALEACTSGNGFVAAADFLFQSPYWPAADRAAFQQWVQQVYRKATLIKTMKFNNNWNDWGTYAALLSDYVLEDADGLKADTEVLKANIAKQIEPDGGMPAELKRGGAGKNWYTYFALTPITCSAVLVHNATGEDLMSRDVPSGKSIRSGIDYFIANLLQRDYHSLIEAAGGIYDDKTYLALNRGLRPINSLRDHNGWDFPTLFLKPDDIPINHPPVAVATASPNPAKTSEDVVFDATASKDPDGQIKSYFWSFPNENGQQAKTFDQSLSKVGDQLDFPDKQQGQFSVDFDLKMEQPGDTAVGLQGSTMTGTSWGSASYLFSVNDGRFTARDGATYRSDADFSYQPDKTYHVRFEVNVPLQLWSVSVTDGTGTIQLAKNYAIRAGAEAPDISKVIYMGAPGTVVSNVRLESLGETLAGARITKKFKSSGKKKASLTTIDDFGAIDTTVITLEVND